MEAINVRYDRLENIAMDRLVAGVASMQPLSVKAGVRYKNTIVALHARRLRELDAHWARDASRYGNRS